MKSLSRVEMGLQQQPSLCRQRPLAQRATLYTRQRLLCAAQHGQNDRSKAPCGAAVASTVSGAMLWASSSHAQDVKGAIDSAAAATTNASGPPTILGLNLFEVILLAAPPTLYGVFNLYRSQVNQKAKLVDFVSILAATIIFGNIVSTLVFKVRLY